MRNAAGIFRSAGMPPEIVMILSFSRTGAGASEIIEYRCLTHHVPRVGDNIEHDDADYKLVPSEHAWDCVVTKVIWDMSERDYDVYVFAEYQNIES